LSLYEYEKKSVVEKTLFSFIIEETETQYNDGIIQCINSARSRFV